MGKPQRVQPIQRIQVSEPTAAWWPPVITHDAIYVPDCYHALFRLALDSLTVQWRLPCEWTMPVLFRGDTLVIGSSEGSFGVRCDDGRRTWGPVATGGCHCWGGHILTARPLAILDPATGELLSQFALADEIVGDTFVTGDLIVGTALRGDPVTAFHLHDERVVWQRSLFAETRTSEEYREPTRVVPCDADTFLLVRKDRIFGCSLLDGQVLWDAPAEMTNYGPLVVSGRLYYLGSNLLKAKGPHLCCIDLMTGRQIYEVPQAVLQYTDTPQPGVGNQRQVVFGSRHGVILACSPSDGQPRWYHKHPPGVRLLALHGGRLLAGTHDGLILAFSVDE